VAKVGGDTPRVETNGPRMRINPTQNDTEPTVVTPTAPRN
jgi:hypothetical protein